MKNIAFIDTEVDVETKKILDMGGVTENGSQFHSNSVAELISFIYQKEYICGHNIINHDLPYLKSVIKHDVSGIKTIDTLFWSPLLLVLGYQ